MDGRETRRVRTSPTAIPKTCGFEDATRFLSILLGGSLIPMVVIGMGMALPWHNRVPPTHTHIVVSVDFLSGDGPAAAGAHHLALEGLAVHGAFKVHRDLLVVERPGDLEADLIAFDLQIRDG